MSGKCSTRGRDEKFVPYCTVSASVGNDPSGIHTGVEFIVTIWAVLSVSTVQLLTTKWLRNSWPPYTVDVNHVLSYFSAVQPLYPLSHIHLTLLSASAFSKWSLFSLQALRSNFCRHSIIIILIGSTALRGPWPSSEASTSWSIRLLLVQISWQVFVSPTPNPRLSWRADVFCQGCLP
jgi:hypothetical protein